MPTERKLLLADDSLTIQKVVSLTFSDEGLAVTAVGSGAAALAQLEREVPDVVLADVHMPAPNGYELCARIKRDERTRRIPVMLLVGSFEPFDEAEARRVGADEVLTKPFQSIRELVNKVGGLLGGQPEAKPSEMRASGEGETSGETPSAVARDDAHAPEAGVEEQASAGATAEAAAPAFADIDLDDSGIESASAEEFAARKTPTEMHDVALLDEEPFNVPAPDASDDEPLFGEGNAAPELGEDATVEPARSKESVAAARAGSETAPSHAPSFEWRAAAAAVADDSLLELGEVEPPRARPAAEADELILDIGEEEPPQFAGPHADYAAYEPPQVAPEDLSSAWEGAPLVSPQADTEPVLSSAPAFLESASPLDAAPPAPVSESQRPVADGADAAQVSTQIVPAPPQTAATVQAGATDLSPETIDQITRRVVELLSDKVVREIAWEVVPDLAERLIRRQLEEERTR